MGEGVAGTEVGVLVANPIGSVAATAAAAVAVDFAPGGVNVAQPANSIPNPTASNP